MNSKAPFFVFIAFAIFSIIFIYHPASASAYFAGCSDTDGGLSFFSAGSVYGKIFNYKYYDACTDSMHLKEYFCTRFRLPAFIGITCSYGCKDGACFKAASCFPNWQCTEWSDCLNNKQTRICIDQNKCTTPTDKPDEIKTCSFQPDLNLILNPSFEETNNNVSPDGWQKGSWGTNDAKFTYPEVGRTGNAALVKISDYKDGDAKWFFDSVSAAPGKEYSFSDFYKSTAPTVIAVQFVLDNGTISYAHLGRLPASPDSWQQASYNFTAPLGAVSLTVFHYIDSIGSLWVDDYSLEDLTFDNSFAQGMISFNFDDGYISAYQNALPLLDSAGIKSSQYIISGALGDTTNGYIDAKEVLNMQAKGHEIGSHSITHSDLTALTSDKVIQEISESKNILEKKGIKNITTFSYPFGIWNSSVEQLAKNAGYKGARTGANYATDIGFNSKKTNPFALKTQVLDKNIPLQTVLSWIDQAAANKTWLILVLHRVENSSQQYNTTPADLAEIISHVKQRGIKTVTNSEGLSLMGY